jgi:hypothetical protein
VPQATGEATEHREPDAPPSIGAARELAGTIFQKTQKRINVLILPHLDPAQRQHFEQFTNLQTLAIELDKVDGQKEDAINKDEYELAVELREESHRLEEAIIRLARELGASST